MHLHLKSAGPLITTLLISSIPCFLLPISGSRSANAQGRPLSALAQTPQNRTAEATYKVGDRVEVLWDGKWWRAKVLQIKGNRYCITYRGYDSSWDECVSSDRIRPTNQATVDPAQKIQDCKADQDRKAHADCLLKQGSELITPGEAETALPLLQQALRLYQELNDRAGKGQTLQSIGNVYLTLEQYERALPYQQQALEIAQQIKDRDLEARAMNNIGLAYQNLKKLDQAIAFYEQSLTIATGIRSLSVETIALKNLGSIYLRKGDFAKATNFYQRVLAIYQTLGDRNQQARFLNFIGGSYSDAENYTQAIAFYQQALTVHKELGNRSGQAEALNGLGYAHYWLSQQPKAIEFYQQALVIFKEIGDRNKEAKVLNGLGNAHHYLGQYSQAIDFHQQALAIYKAVGNRNGQASALHDLANDYSALGQSGKATELRQQVLALYKELGNRSGQASVLSNIGASHLSSGQTSKAIELYQQALAIYQETGHRYGQAQTLKTLGNIYNSLGQPNRAIEFYQQALPLFKSFDEIYGQAYTLHSLGQAYAALKQYGKAVELYQQALPILKDIGDREGEGRVFASFGRLLVQQNQPELAIAFYKQSVNVREQIRQGLRNLERSQQESYTQTVVGTYRALANLLLEQGRVLEAQQVLELLKGEEIREFTRNASLKSQTPGIAINPFEEKILKEHGTLIEFGQKVEQCKQTRCLQLSQLNDQLQGLTQQYNRTIQTAEAEIRKRRAEDEAFLDPRRLPKLQEIVEAQPGTVLIYPLLLQDKLWLVWASRGGVVKSVEVPVTQKQLGETVLQFRQAIQTPNPAQVKEAQALGKKLHGWLIQPIEPELKANKIQNLVFSLDRVTRYIPMSALFDGEKYLIENYTISTVLSADLTDLGDKLPPGTDKTAVLAMGASDFKDFSPLPNVSAELDGIVRQKLTNSRGIYPGLKFLNKAFDFRTLRDKLFGHKILHVATHGKFVAGRPEESFLVLGTGEKLTISGISTLLDLNKVHLVVLSACETALGGPDQDGIEIAGISSYFLRAGAKAVMASLWSVDDSSTAYLMQEFYKNLANSTSQNPVTKAQALRQAQLSLLNAGGSSSRPYHWAPFILIGNGF